MYWTEFWIHIFLRLLFKIIIQLKDLILLNWLFHLFTLTSSFVSKWKRFASDGILKIIIKLGLSYITSITKDGFEVLNTFWANFDIKFELVFRFTIHYWQKWNMLIYYYKKIWSMNSFKKKITFAKTSNSSGQSIST